MPDPLSNTLLDEVHDLTLACLSGEASPEEIAKLDGLLRSNPVARRIYTYAVLDSYQLRRWAMAENRSIDRDISEDPGELLNPSNAGALSAAFSDDELSGNAAYDISAISSIPIAGISSTTSRNFYLSGWPLAYLIATVICGVGLVIAAFTYVSQPTDIARHSNNSNPQSPIRNSSSVVARITGTADCRWEKREGLGIRDWGLEEGSRFKVQGSRSKQLQSPNLRISKSLNPQIPKSLVFLGDQFILSAGLMEITYNTGARVILQGPCTFEVDSAAGGFLTVGKLTARVEQGTKYGVRSTERVANESRNPEIPKSPNPLLTTNHYPLFTIKTPTATITDLGTEFGVEVGPEQDHRVYVFQGRVAVESVAKSKPQKVVLAEGEYFQNHRGVMVQNRLEPSSGLAAMFVRQLPCPPRETQKLLSLADLAAGGDGFGQRVNWGIDPRTALPATKNKYPKLASSGKYEVYTGHAYIDGVFIPTGGEAAVQLDSAKHAFEFSNACGKTYGMIWTRASRAMSGPPEAVALIPELEKQHRELLMHICVGATFDLSAMRAALPDWNVARFQTVVANVRRLEKEPEYPADFWVFADGQLRFKRLGFSGEENIITVDLPLKPTDRFLTLVTTGDETTYTREHVHLHEPRLILEAGDKSQDPAPAIRKP